jgi:hypothetical protein
MTAILKNLLFNHLIFNYVQKLKHIPSKDINKTPKGLRQAGAFL